MYGMGMQELLIIGAIAMLIFGPKQLPKLGRSLGETLRAVRDIPKEINGDGDDERG